MFSPCPLEGHDKLHCQEENTKEQQRKQKRGWIKTSPPVPNVVISLEGTAQLPGQLRAEQEWEAESGWGGTDQLCALGAVMPRFTEQVEAAVEALSSDPAQPMDENEFIDASRLVYDGIRDIRKAVLMIRVSTTSSQLSLPLFY